MRLSTKVVLIISITVTTIISIMFFVLANHFERQIERHLITTARAVYDNIVIVRKWVSDKEGVFVVKKKGEQINRFLTHPLLMTAQGDSLVMRNPALVTRELSELSLTIGKDFSYHLASLNYINPANSPDAFEEKALRFYEKNPDENQNKSFYRYEKINNSSYFRYFAPLYTRESCLSCHAEQGYQLGDVRGGISILLSAEEHKISKRNHLLFFLATGLFSIIFLSVPMFYAIKRSLISPLKEIEKSADKIRDGHYDFKLTYTKNDEIGNLGRAFENMRQKIRDYTNRLVESENKYRNLIEHSLEAVAIIDENNNIIECNRILSKFTGFEYENLKGKKFNDLFDQERARPLPFKFDSEFKAEHMETYLHSKDDILIPVEIYLIKGFVLGNKSNLSFIYIRDLSERKKIEQYSIQTEKIFALGQISSGIAHEIRNPLFAINNNLDYLRDKFKNNTDFNEIYPEMRVSIDRIQNIVSAILDYARPHDLSFGLIQIEDVIKRSLLLVQKQFEKSSIRIVTHFEPDAPAVEADPHKLEQVFVNLFLNAFQAMPGAGELKITTRLKKRHLTVDIEDTGHGMTDDEIKRVFDPFFTKFPNGTGLGMSIVQRILDKHNAHYRIKSEAGLGTVFSILFHLKQD